MISQYEDPIYTATRFSDGWFRTGDQGYLQDDLLFLLGRTNPIVRPKI